MSLSMWGQATKTPIGPQISLNKGGHHRSPWSLRGLPRKLLRLLPSLMVLSVGCSSHKGQV